MIVNLLCNDCNSKVSEEDIFCSNCGLEITLNYENIREQILRSMFQPSPIGKEILNENTLYLKIYSYLLVFIMVLGLLMLFFSVYYNFA